MLQILRNKAQSAIIQAVVLIIAVVFVFWGVGTNMMQSGRDAAIVINGEEITFQQFQLRYDQTLADYRRQFGDAVSDELLQGLGIKQQVINQLTQTALLRQGAQAMGLMVAPEEIRLFIQQMPQFQQNGAFSMDLYKAILTANRMNPHGFETSIGEDLLVQKALAAISGFAATVGPLEISEFRRQEEETVTVNVIRVSPDRFGDAVQVDDTELTAWFEDQKERYKGEKKVKLKYLFFPYQSAMENISVSDEQILARYEKDKATHQIPERRQARHILFKVDPESSAEHQAAQLKKAQETLTRARTGQDFGILAKELSEDASSSRGGDLGAFARGRMVREFDDAVFSMQPGTISDVVKTGFGYHIIKLEKILPATTRPIEEVRADIVSALAAEQARSVTFQKANSAYEEIIAGGSLQAYADQHGNDTLITTDFFSRTSPTANLETDPMFLDTIFSLKQGELSSLIETPSGYFIVFAETIQEPVIPPLEEVKERVVKDFRQDQARKKAKEVAEDLLTRVTAGADVAATAKENGLEVVKSGPLRRNPVSFDPTLPASLTRQALRLGPNTPFPKEPLAVGDDLYILQFLERLIPDSTSLNEETKSEYSALLLRQKQEQLLGSWLLHQEKISQISFNKNLMK